MNLSTHERNLILKAVNAKITNLKFVILSDKNADPGYKTELDGYLSLKNKIMEARTTGR